MAKSLLIGDDGSAMLYEPPGFPMEYVTTVTIESVTIYKTSGQVVTYIPDLLRLTFQERLESAPMK